MNKYLILTEQGFMVTSTLFDTIEDAKVAVMELSSKYNFDLKAKIITQEEYKDYLQGLLALAEAQYIILK